MAKHGRALAVGLLLLPLILAAPQAGSAWDGPVVEQSANSSLVLAGKVCQKETGHHCNVLSCPSSYGPTVCAGSFMSHTCVCAEGYCLSVGGVCKKPAELATCQQDSGGTCTVLGCNAWRGRTNCVDGRCLCAKGLCATPGGFCEAPLAPGRGGCVTFTGSTCTVSGLCLAPFNVECVRNEGLEKLGSCMCTQGTCLWRGLCLHEWVIQLIHHYSRPVLALLAFGTFFWCVCVPLLGSGYLLCKALGWAAGPLCRCRRRREEGGAKQEPLLSNEK
uniref:EGF-like domain-containing protein n=1 Tax=Alexandrium monilatum TaxID=311494 RepID=A0A7S4V7W8_9DINO